MLNSGFWTITQFAGAPVRVHWTVLLLMLFFGGWEPAAWVGILIIIMIHELGHAAVVRWVGGRVTEVMAYGFGGYCSWQGRVSSRGHALIAWGGVAAQAVLLVLAYVFLAVVPVTDRFTYIVLHTFTQSNLHLILLNLLPIAPLDGASAWPLLPILRDDIKRWWASQRRAKPPVRAKPRAKVIPLDPNAAKKAEEASTSRVTDPKEADRIFNKVFKDLVDQPHLKGEAKVDQDQDPPDSKN